MDIETIRKEFMKAGYMLGFRGTTSSFNSAAISHLPFEKVQKMVEDRFEADYKEVLAAEARKR
jgi:hypothetical protein